MNIYQLTILEKDEIHRDAILKLAKKYNASFSSPFETKDGSVFEFDFPNYEQMKQFKEELNKLRPRLF